MLCIPVGLKSGTRTVDDGKIRSRAQSARDTFIVTESTEQAGDVAQWENIYLAVESPWVRTLEVKGGSEGGTTQPINKEFEKKYNPTWHCILGRNFGSYVPHETRPFINFCLSQLAHELGDTHTKYATQN